MRHTGKLLFPGWSTRMWVFFRRWAGPLVLAGLAAAAAASTAACESTDTTRDECAREKAADDSDCQEEPATTTAVPTDCESTGGTCVHEAPDGWFGPNLYWIGPSGENPGCPPEAPLPGNDAHADLGPVEHICPSCACGPSETSCLLSTTWTLAAAPCSDADNATLTPFDVLVPDWTGTCNQDNAIVADALCGDEPCAQSVTVGAPEALSAPCAPESIGQEYRPGPPWPWGKVAQECLVTPSDTCSGGEAGEGRACIPTPGDFMACVTLDHGEHEGDVDCPPFYDDEQYVMYRDAQDTRSCTACACGDPAGGECAVQASVYGDAGCSDIMGLVVVFSGDRQACFDVSAGVALGSKSAEVKAATGGTCASKGGESGGDVVPAGRVTICCHHDVSE